MHDRPPPIHVEREQTTTHVMHVIVVSIIGRAGGDDRFKMLWRMRGDLQTVESTPGNAGHANVSIAPLLGGKPFDHFADVELFPW